MWWERKGKSNMSPSLCCQSVSPLLQERHLLLHLCKLVLGQAACSWWLERPVPDHHVDISSLKTAGHIAYPRDQGMKRKGTVCRLILLLSGASNMHLLMVQCIQDLLRHHREEMIRIPYSLVGYCTSALAYPTWAENHRSKMDLTFPTSCVPSPSDGTVSAQSSKAASRWFYLCHHQDTKLLGAVSANFISIHPPHL